MPLSVRILESSTFFLQHFIVTCDLSVALPSGLLKDGRKIQPNLHGLFGDFPATKLFAKRVVVLRRLRCSNTDHIRSLCGCLAAPAASDIWDIWDRVGSLLPPIDVVMS